MQTVNLGNSRLRVSRLSIGTGTVGGGGRSNQTKLGLKGFVDLLCFAHDLGVRFWDAADAYGSHSYIKENPKIFGSIQRCHYLKDDLAHQKGGHEGCETFLEGDRIRLR